MRHLRPVGKPAPPRPRRPESSSVVMTDSTSRSPATQCLQQRVAAARRGRRRSRCRPSGRSRFGRLAATCGRHLLAAARAARRSGPPPTAGACSQRPMQGAAITRTSVPSSAGRRASRSPRAGHLAGQAVADAHGQRGRRRFAFLHDVEVVIEARDLVDLGLRQAHLLRQRRQVRGRQVAEAVLDLVQVLDQQVALARLVAEQALHVGERGRVDAAALRGLALALLRDFDLQDRDGDDLAVHSGVARGGSVHMARLGSGSDHALGAQRARSSAL